MIPTEIAKRAAVQFALSMGKIPHRQKFNSGGPVTTGPLVGPHGGRTDTLPITVPGGSYVIPADVVSGIPGAEGNSLAGHAALTKLFGQMAGAAPVAPSQAGPAMAKGGSTKEVGRPVDILAAGGEFVIPPHAVAAIGKGNIRLGHEILDDFVKHVREKNIKDLKNLPGPAKR